MEKTSGKIFSTLINFLKNIQEEDLVGIVRDTFNTEGGEETKNLRL
jgi:hypothetical protein